MSREPRVLWESELIRGERYRVVGMRRGGAPVSNGLSDFREMPILLAVEVAQGLDAMGSPIWIRKTSALTLQLAWDLVQANGLPAWVADEIGKQRKEETR